MPFSLIVGWRRLAACALSLTAVGASACASSTITTLEFDRMNGTVYPTDQLLNGDNYTVERMYAEAGQLLRIDYDTTNIEPLNFFEFAWVSIPQQCITNAELDAVMDANRYSPTEPTSRDCREGAVCTEYHLYGIVTNHQGTDAATGACDPKATGLMFRTDNRSAFAIFYRNTLMNTDPAMYLRTTAHEIGHAYNLHHQDSSGTSIMTRTGDLGATYNYTFSGSQGHLDTHPADCVYPGVGVFGDVDAAHTDHADITVVTC